MKKGEILQRIEIIHLCILCLFILSFAVSCAPELSPYVMHLPQKSMNGNQMMNPGNTFLKRVIWQQFHKELTPYRDNLVLTQLIDVALQNSPQTEKAWAEARAAAAAWAVSRGSLYPTIDGAASAKRSKFDASSGLISFETDDSRTCIVA